MRVEQLLKNELKLLYKQNDTSVDAVKLQKNIQTIPARCLESPFLDRNILLLESQVSRMRSQLANAQGGLFSRIKFVFGSCCRAHWLIES